MEYDKIVYYEAKGKGKDKIIDKIKNILTKEKRIKVAYIFGSFINRNKFRDIDIAIYAIPELNFDEQLMLGSVIEMELEIAIDLVQIQDLNPCFRFKILKNGIPIIKNVFHHYLIAQSYSECMDFSIAIKKVRK